MKINILIAEDHHIVRDGLKALLENEKNIEVVGEASDGIDAVKKAKSLRPHIVIMDLAMPVINGIEATRQINGEMKDIKVIALSMHSDRRFIIEILRAGAKGFVLKQAAFEELVAAINSVYKGNAYLSTDIVDVVVQDYVRQLIESDSPAYRKLTDRERQVLKLLAEGKSTKEIAYALDVSVKTVESHRLNIRDKMGIDNLASLTKFAIREGLTTLDV